MIPYRTEKSVHFVVLVNSATKGFDMGFPETLGLKVFVLCLNKAYSSNHITLKQRTQVVHSTLK